MARRAASSGPVRAVLSYRPVEQVVATLIRSRLVRESARFAARELSGWTGTSRYLLRAQPATVFIRHGTGDLATLDEVFLRRHYEPPEELRIRGPGPRIVDLGANIGLSAAFFLLQNPDAQITAVEPDPENATLLSRCLHANGWDDAAEVIEAAAATAAGEVVFQPGRVALSRIAASGEDGIAVPSVDVFPLFRGADLVKMDIEGGEWAILGDERFAEAPPVVVLEYHPHLCPDPDPPEAVVRLLQRSGYVHRPLFRSDDGHGMLWATRADR